MSAVATQPDWLTALRDAGRARFGEAGLPTQRQEIWKYTGLNKLKALTFEPSADIAGTAPAIEPLIDAAHRLTFVNGRFDAARSRIGALPGNAILASLAEILRDRPNLLEGRMGVTAAIDRRPMAALNTAWIEDGLVLIVPRGVAVEGVIEAVFVNTGEAPVAHPRLLVALGDMAEVVLVERHLGGGGGGFTNQVAEIALGDGASFRHYVHHAEPTISTALETVTVTVGRDASYRSFGLAAGGGLVRREIEVVLRQPGGFAQVDGAYLVDGERHADTTVLIDHQADHCASRQTHKGVIDDDGRAVYQGKILVRPHAQKTDGYQLSQTLLLSGGAEADVKPELEIHADDVKCSHGATVGRLDADALFFLRARGIPEAEARALLIQGFIGGALDEIDRPDVREAFGAAASNWLTAHSESTA
ncbi:MAG TPA: Fe-S cluster assembly protein SufD [Alphaproteobacteria bacterium]|jgi:Fe-S cluster assembly protein SufD|nr:Fe-S cluster assembly protein SufD [Alphaproteobacteria bacterium]